MGFAWLGLAGARLGREGRGRIKFFCFFLVFFLEGGGGERGGARRRGEIVIGDVRRIW